MSKQIISIYEITYQMLHEYEGVEHVKAYNILDAINRFYESRGLYGITKIEYIGEEYYE